MERAAINRVSVADQVATVLRQKILTGELRPGTSLQDLPLASSLGVSRNTLREALRILSLEGLLERNLHRGVAVAQLALADIQEIYQLRRMLEIPAVLRAKTPKPDVLREMRVALDEYDKALRAREWVRAVSSDLQFHSLLIRFYDNKRLEVFYGKVIGELRMGMVLVDRGHDNPAGLIPTHRKIYQLLSGGKLKECANLLARHLRDSESRLTRLVAKSTAKKPSQPANGMQQAARAG